MPSIIVQKYGGACLATPESLRQVATYLADLHGRGHQVVAIVSAMGKATDDLIRLAYQVSPRPNRRELDMLLTTGERVSMSLMSMALSDLGVPAISFTGSQAGVMTDGSHSQARITNVKPIRVREELDRGRLVVLAGFQGVNPDTKEITTLGRGGSDTTAVAMAAALGAERCEIIKEVDGVCSADPKLVPNCRPLRHLDFASLSEMCFWGAKVLHLRSVEMAQMQNVTLIIKKWGEASHATEITHEVKNMEQGRILSVNSLPQVEHLEIAAADLNAAFVRLSEHLKSLGLAWPQILASAQGESGVRIVLTGDPEYLTALLAPVNDASGIKVIKESMSSVTMTCHGEVGSDLPHRALKALSEVNIAPDKYILSPHSLTLFVKQHQRESAMRTVHRLIPE